MTADAIPNIGPAQPLVLLVESDPAVARMLVIALRSGGFGTIVASCGDEAIRLLDERPFSAVVLEACLDDGMGRAVLRRLNEDAARGDALVLLSAAGREDSLRELGPVAGPILTHPFSPWLLVDVLRSLTARG